MEIYIVIAISIVALFLFIKFKNKKYPQKKGKGVWTKIPKDESNPIEDANEKGY